MVRQRLAIAGVALFCAAGAVCAQTEAVQTDAAPMVADSVQPMLAQDGTTGADSAPSLPGASSAPAQALTAPIASPQGELIAEAVTPFSETTAEKTPQTAPVEATGANATADAKEAFEAPVFETTPEFTPDKAPGVGTVLSNATDSAVNFLVTGGPSIWAIAALSVITVALILWKIWRLVLAGAWSRRTSRKAVDAWEQGEASVALAMVQGRTGLRSRLVHTAMRARMALNDEAAREETARVARRLLTSQGTALRALELMATIAPLLGLLGTVMGMISAFQALQEAGSSADPALLAGGIWEALLTTAAGMAVAIPASAALTWFEAVVDNLRADLEDLSARIFIADLPGQGMGQGMARASNISKLAAQ